jgi:transcriptional regulator with XRE-family HTH domain
MLDAQVEVRALRRFARLVRKGQLAELREDAGLTQSDLARYLGISPSNVSRWESGLARPRPAHAAAVLELLDGDD